MMIGYLDQVWCIHSSRAQRELRCMNEACPRNITDAHFERAEKCGLPIFSLADMRKEDCGYRSAGDGR